MLTGAPTSPSAASRSLIPFGTEPTPAFQAASIMFCAARPTSKPAASPAIATASCAPSTFARGDTARAPGERDSELLSEHVRRGVHELRHRLLVAEDDELPLLRVLGRAA